MAEKREQIIQLWFDMWLKAVDLGISDIFSTDAVYTESWGPEYRGLDKIRLWFQEWNTRGTVLRWDIRQFFHKGDQTVVQWDFCNRMDDGRTEPFEGLSLIRWDASGRIAFCRNSAATRPGMTPTRTARSPNSGRSPPAGFERADRQRKTGGAGKGPVPAVRRRGRPFPAP